MFEANKSMLRSVCILLLLAAPLRAYEVVEVEGQPLAAQAIRLVDAFEFLGSPLDKNTLEGLKKACEVRDAAKIQQILDPLTLVNININPEARVKAARGKAEASIQQHAYTPFLVKVVNEAKVTSSLKVSSPQMGPVYSGGGAGKVPGAKDKFFHGEIFTAPPLMPTLSGLKVEYSILLVYSSEAGMREVNLSFDVGQGTQDLGFRSEVPLLFKIRPAIEVKLKVLDENGKPTVGSFVFRDKAGHVFPSQIKRLAPDFFFQKQIYRADGGTVLLPSGEYTMISGRGPEYFQGSRKVVIPEKGPYAIEVKLERWIDAAKFGFYSGDHHIHAAGCAHYTNPTEGVFADDMFLHVKGEGLNVGCNLTWGPCYDFQRQFFEPGINKKSEPFTVLKYDIEVSGFGSQALGHVCLLNLKDQTYPGSEGTKTKGWPTWTTPLMKWAKAQGAVTGYAHSANGLAANPERAALRLFASLDSNKDDKITKMEADASFLPLPEKFADIDSDKDGMLDAKEFLKSHQRMADMLPNLLIPEMDGIGAQEICVTTSLGLCDFISAMDTHRVREWSCWYHLMNCGFPLKVSGETDFPCITGSRVGQGRVYVQMGKLERIDFADWCEGLAKGRSYVSDGYAHALDFKVNDKRPGTDEITLGKPGSVAISAKVTFASDSPLGTAVGAAMPEGKNRLVEFVMNGKVIKAMEIPADGKIHDISFNHEVNQSSWIALRSYPQMHTNPVNIKVGGKPIRVSKDSAKWCIGVIEQLWRVRKNAIAENERGEAEKTFLKAIEVYKKIASENNS
ncbi:MAG: EF-hand domain-containing protein [Gemmataceae bacterium]|nr:EF-hand domain-containing protein [Gemmataceae bacterium]